MVKVLRKYALHAMLWLGFFGLPMLLHADEALDHIATLIFNNECAGDERCLTAWNEGEAFASLGIGHFIWYPQGVEKPFQESFPVLLQFMQQRGERLPEWLEGEPSQPNPWRSREQFLAAYSQEKMQSLRHFLSATKPLQAEFMQQRLRLALPKMLANLTVAEAQTIRAQFECVAASPMGIYLLMDYVNFKGEGSSVAERYQGEGWGLRQVLAGMRVHEAGREAVVDFARSADAVLTRRVALSPPDRHEERWLAGWRKRLVTYRDVITP